MSTTRVRVDPADPASLPKGRVDHEVTGWYRHVTLSMWAG